MGIDQLQPVIPMIRYHHENFDGSGYPHQLENDAIPLAARIIRVADSFDSMMSTRPYRPAPGFKHAMDELRRCSGNMYDPTVVTAFLMVLEQEFGANHEER